MRLENLANEATATRATAEGSKIIPSLAEIKDIRALHFRVEASTAEVQSAVNGQLAKLGAKYKGWKFTAEFQ